MEAEAAVMQPEAKEFQEPPEVQRGKEVSSPEGFTGSMASWLYQHLDFDFWLPEL